MVQVSFRWCHLLQGLNLVLFSPLSLILFLFPLQKNKIIKKVA
jgi:hypothetical protein